MKPRRLSIARLSFPLAASIAALLATQSAHAAIYYWDGNNGTAGFGTAAGTWAAPTTGTATSGWSTDATGATVVLSNSVTTATTDTLNFGTAATGLAAGTITVSGTVDAGDITFASASGAIVLSGSTINLAAASTITVNNASDTISSTLSGAGTSFTKAGSGALVLTVSNTYTGATNINAGTLELSGSGSILSTSGITLNGGSLTLTNTAAETGSGRVHDSNAITSNGGTLTYNNTSGTNVYAETIGSVALTSGQLNIVQAVNQAGAGSQTLTLAGLNRTGATNTSAITFSANTTAPNATKNMIKVTSASGAGAGQNLPGGVIIGPWATTGTAANAQTDYAVYDASGFVLPANITATAESTWSTAANAYTLSTPAKTATVLGATRNIMALKASSTATATTSTTTQNSPNFTISTGTSFNVGDPVVLSSLSAEIGQNTTYPQFTVGTVYYVASTTATTFTLAATPGGTAINAGAAVTASFTGGLRLDSSKDLGTYGILNSGAAPFGIGRTAAGGTVTLPASGAGNLYVTAGTAGTGTANSGLNGFIIIDAPIVDNGGALTLVKSGAGVLRLSGTNTYTGGTVINGGVVAFTSSSHFGSASSPITFNGSGTLSFGPNYSFGFANGGTADLGTHPLTLNNGAVAGLYYNSPNTTMTMSGAITGNGGIIVGADPTLTFNGGNGTNTFSSLSNSNTFTGPLTLTGGSAGTFSSTFNSLADSTSTITFNLAGNGSNFDLGSGALQNLSVPNRPIVLLTSLSTIRNQNASFTMTLGPVSTSTAGAKTLNLGNGGFGGTIAGNITDGIGQIAVTKAGTGTWFLSNTGNSYTGGTNVSAGTLQLGASNVLPDAGAVSVTGGILQLSTFSDTVGVVNISGGTIDGTTAVLSGSRVVATGTSTISAILGGSGSLSRAIAGSTTSLTKANTYSGGTTVVGGTLAVGASGTLGQNVVGNGISISEQGILTLAAAANSGSNQTITFASSSSSDGRSGNLAVLGLGFNGLPTGAIAQANTAGGVIAINAVTGYNTDLSSTLTGKNLFLGAIGTSTFTGAAGTVAAGNGSLYRLGGGGGTITFNTTNLFTGANGLQIGSSLVNGGGTVVISAAQDYSGATTVSAGTLTLSGAGGTATGTSSFTLNGNKLFLDNTGTNNADRIGTVAVSLSTGGELSLSGNASGTTETIGDLSIGAGSTTVTVKATTANSTLAAGAFTRSDNGTALFRGTSLGQNVTPMGRVTLTGTGGLTFVGASTLANAATGDTTKDVRIIPYLVGDTTDTGNGTTFVTYDTTLGFRALSTANQFNTTVTAGANVRFVTTARTGITTNSINSLIVAVAGNTIADANTLTVTSGALLFSATGSIAPAGTTGVLDFGAAQGVITTAANGTISAPITGSAGIIKSGTGTLTLSGTNTFTGGLVINAGNVTIGSIDSLGAANGTVTVNANTTLTTANAVMTLQKSFVLNNSALLSFSNGSSPITITGAVTGTGGIAPQGAGSAETRTLTLQSTANTFAGPIVLGWTAQNFGAISVVSLLDDATHTGAITFGTGASSYGSFIWEAGGPSALTLNNRQIWFTGSAATSTGVIKNNNTSNAITINTALAVDGVGSKTLQLDGVAGPTNVFAGVIGNGSGTVSLTKAGAGTWALSGSNTYTGATTITTGILDFANKAAKTAATATAAAAGSVGLGVKASDAAYYSATDVGNLFNTNTLAGFSLNAASGVAIDTTNAGADFDQTVALTAGRSLTKLGTGTLTLSGTNTYSGSTTISAGTLALGASNVLPSTAVSIGAATLNAATFSDTVGTLDPTAAAIINLGSGGALAFAASNAVSWTGGTLNLTGTFVSGSSIRFGTTSGGLTSGQLAVISVNGSGAGTCTLDSSGYLVAAGPGPVDHFVISAISGTKTVGTAITGITLTAQDASNATATSFSGTVTFGGTGGFTGTSGNFVLGVLTGVSVTPTNAGTNFTFTVTDGASPTAHTGTTTIATIQSTYDAWSNRTFANGILSDKNSAHDPDGDGHTNLQEYAFGTDPTVNANGSIVWVANGAVTNPGQPVAHDFSTGGGGVDYRAVYGRRKDYVAAGLTYTVQFSANLSDWTSGNDNLTVLTGAGGANPSEIEAMSVTYPLFVPVTTPVAGFAKPTFLRVVVTGN